MKLKLDASRCFMKQKLHEAIAMVVLHETEALGGRACVSRGFLKQIEVGTVHGGRRRCRHRIIKRGWIVPIEQMILPTESSAHIGGRGETRHAAHYV